MSTKNNEFVLSSFTEPGALQPRRLKIGVILAIVSCWIISIACVSTSGAASFSREVGKLSSGHKQQLQTLIDRGLVFPPGDYEPGKIPVGEYAFVSAEGGYYSEKFNGQTLDIESFDSFGYVHNHGLGNIKTQGFLLTEQALKEMGVANVKELYELMIDRSDYRFSGYYKIGVDIPAGEYSLQSVGEGFVAIETGPVGDSQTEDNDIFSGTKRIWVSNGQYLKLWRVTIVQ